MLKIYFFNQIKMKRLVIDFFYLMRIAYFCLSLGLYNQF